MTGNTVLLGIAVAQGHGDAAMRSATALAGFCVGAVLGTALAGSAVAFVGEGILLAALVGLGAAGLAHVPLIAVAGAAMGLQTATVRRRNDTGVNVTYITGTLTTLVSSLTDRVLGREPQAEPGSRGPALPAAVWLSYGAGALSGAALASAWHTAAFALPAAAALLTALVPLGRDASARATS